MSSFSTTVPSRAQMYCCFSRDPQSLWIQLKRDRAVVSPVEYILTGTETRPNDTVAVPMARALISLLYRGIMVELQRESGYARGVGFQ
jgi:hypothetical protein